jgi:hypothetical protein
MPSYFRKRLERKEKEKVRGKDNTVSEVSRERTSKGDIATISKPLDASSGQFQLQSQSNRSLERKRVDSLSLNGTDEPLLHEVLPAPDLWQRAFEVSGLDENDKTLLLQSST